VTGIIKKTQSVEKVEASIVEHFKGEKLRVSKFKAKARYRRTTGFRAYLTKVKVEKISGETKVKAEPKVKKIEEKK
jgi:large subunit ribosomal protein L21